MSRFFMVQCVCWC